jgi:hypothetical protein
VVRKSLLSAAVIGLIIPSAAFAVKPAPTAKKVAAKKPGVPAKSTATKVASTPAPVKPGLDTCEFQVRTRSKVGYRGSATYWVKGKWVREEKRSGGGMELIMVNNDKGLFIRNKHSKYWFRYPEQMAVNLRDRLLGGPVGQVKPFLKAAKATYLGKEKVDGVMCNIWAYRLKGADDKFRLWTDLGNTRPIRMERDHLVPGTKKRDVLVVEYKRYAAGHALSDSLFGVPEGQKVHDMRNSLSMERLRRKLAAELQKKQSREAPAPSPSVPNTPAPGKPAPEPGK